MSASGNDSHPRPFTSSVVKRNACLVGEEGVGKTSLIRRFVTGGVDETYGRTLGAVVSKKSFDIEGAEGRVRADLTVYDITRQRSCLELFRHAYLTGAAGAL